MAGDVGLSIAHDDLRNVDLQPPSLGPRPPAAEMELATAMHTSLRPVPLLVQKLRPGVALVKGFLSPMEQQAIVDLTRTLGLEDGGFYRPSYGNRGKQQLFMMNFGWHWNLQSRLYEATRSDYDQVCAS